MLGGNGLIATIFNIVSFLKQAYILSFLSKVQDYNTTRKHIDTSIVSFINKLFKKQA